MTFHESRSVCYGFSQISERLPGLILKRGAKSQMLRASEIFWERLWNVWYQKNAQKISNIQTLPFPKPAHLQWAQDQGDPACTLCQIFFIGYKHLLHITPP